MRRSCGWRRVCGTVLKVSVSRERLDIDIDCWLDLDVDVGYSISVAEPSGASRTDLDDLRCQHRRREVCDLDDRRVVAMVGGCDGNRREKKREWRKGLRSPSAVERFCYRGHLALPFLSGAIRPDQTDRTLPEMVACRRRRRRSHGE